MCIATGHVRSAPIAPVKADIHASIDLAVDEQTAKQHLGQKRQSSELSPFCQSTVLDWRKVAAAERCRLADSRIRKETLCIQQAANVEWCCPDIRCHAAIALPRMHSAPARCERYAAIRAFALFEAP